MAKPSPPPAPLTSAASAAAPARSPHADANPGLLNLKLTANFKGHPSEFERKQAKCKLGQLQDYLVDSTSRPHRFAISNFIAVLHYQLGEEESALDVLEDLLEEDEYNTNALQDLAIIYDKYHRKDDSQKCLQKLKAQLVKIGNGDGNDESRVGYARMLAGKALAWGFDLHPDTKGTHRLDNSIALYEKALDIAEDLVGVEEKFDWLYYLALDYTRLNNIKNIKEEDHYHITFDKAVRCLVPNHSSSDALRKSGSWCLLGNLFSQRPRHFAATFLPPIIGEFDLERCWKNPELCYLRAIEFNENNVIARNRLAQLYYSDGKEKEALEQLHVSLQLNSRPTNHDAYRRRARINRLKFNKDFKQKRKADRNLLLQAVDDLGVCIKCNPYVLDMIHLAEVHHKLSWKARGDHDFKHIHKALHWCTKAEEYQDGAERPELHQRRALILQDMGDHENALKSFMQAMDFENKGTTYNRNFLYMYSSMLKRYHNVEEKPKHLLQQLVYWFVEGMVKYEKTNIKVSYFVTRYPQEMLNVIEVLSKTMDQLQLDLAQSCLKAFRDTRVEYDVKMQRNLETATSDAIEELLTATPGSPSGSRSKSVAKAKLTLETSPSKKLASPQVINTPHQKGQLLEPQQESAQPQEADALATSISAVGLHSNDSPMETSGREVSTPSQLPLASPESTPLSKFLKTSGQEMSSTESSGQVIHDPFKTPARPSRPSLPSQGESPVTPSSEPSPMSQKTTPSTPGSSYRIIVETPESAKSVKGEFCMKKEEASYLNVWEEFKRILDETDLQLEDMGDAPETSQHSNFEYDFHVIYDRECKKIKDFVYYHLLAQLEEGKIPLKGCIQERDFIIGKEIFENMENAIRDSAKVIILLSTGFFNNKWCKQAQQLAFLPDNSDKVFPIQLEDVVIPSRYGSIHCIDARKTINWSVIRKQLEPPGLPTPPP